MNVHPSHAVPDPWPPLPLNDWKDTYATLHMWTQLVGKIRLALAPHVNHWWQVPLYVTARGLTTSPIPYGRICFEIEFDFIDHELRINTSTSERRAFALAPFPVADFYGKLMDALQSLAISVRIWTLPVEVAEPIPFEKDELHKSYDAEYAHRFWRVLLQADRVLKMFRSGYTGKASPVHFFWGSFDLALTYFSGRRAPPHPGAPHVADRITREAYSHEVSSLGFWPGGGPVDGAVFYAYAYPEPANYKKCGVQPTAAFYSEELREFLLPYDVVRTLPSPEDAVLAFAQSTYLAAAENWNGNG